jgi:amidase
MSQAVLTGDHHISGFGAVAAPALNVNCGEPFWVETRDRFVALPDGGARVDAPGNVVGPVFVDGVKAGDVLAIEVMTIEPLTGTGYLLASSSYGILGDRVESRARPVSVSSDSVVIRPNVSLPYRPMIGKLGIAPAPGEVATTAVGSHGGPLSITQLGPGTTLLLDVKRDGAELCLEDVHACMGEGEGTASAVEMAARVQLCCRVWTSYAPAALPVLLTADELLVVDEAPTLEGAVRGVTDKMLEVLMARCDVDLTEAAMLAGAVVDVRLSYFGTAPARARAAVPRLLINL